MPNILIHDLLIISCSLNRESKSRALARFLQQSAQLQEISCCFVDLQETTLPFCDGGPSYSHPSVIDLQKKVVNAKAILIATPIYNYTVSAAAKNFIELMGTSLCDKTLAVVCTVGSSTSYLAPGNFLLSCLFDFRCHIVPKIVFADPSHFDEKGTLQNDKVKERLQALLTTTIQLGNLHYQHHQEVR